MIGVDEFIEGDLFIPKTPTLPEEPLDSVRCSGGPGFKPSPRKGLPPYALTVGLIGLPPNDAYRYSGLF